MMTMINKASIIYRVIYDLVESMSCVLKLCINLRHYLSYFRSYPYHFFLFESILKVVRFYFVYIFIYYKTDYRMYRYSVQYDTVSFETVNKF